MVASHSKRLRKASPSLVRRLAWPGTISVVLAAIAACGGSSEGSNDWGDPSAGSGGALGISGSTGVAGGNHTGTAGSTSTSASGSTTGGKQSSGGQPSQHGGSNPTPEQGGNDAGGGAGKPPRPPMPHDMGGADGVGADCPTIPPTDKAECTDLLKCKYPELNCNCEGPEDDRAWKCKAPKPMCPAMPPKDADACKTTEPPAPPCHYEKPAVNCACVANAWACTAVL